MIFSNASTKENLLSKTIIDVDDWNMNSSQKIVHKQKTKHLIAKQIRSSFRLESKTAALICIRYKIV